MQACMGIYQLDVAIVNAIFVYYKNVFMSEYTKCF